MLLKIKLALQILRITKKNWKTIVTLLLILIMLPFLLISAISSMFSWKDWEKEKPSNYEPYKKLAMEHSLVWQELFIIDLIKHDMDQDKLEPKLLEDYFIYYVNVEVEVCQEVEDKDKKKVTQCHTETRKEKRIRPFEEVMMFLGFTEEQVEMARDSLSLLLEDTGGSSVITPIGTADIPAQYIPIYKAAEARYGVPWNLLAAHHRVETVFSTINPMISSVGAEGHMQFMPCTFIGWSHPTCSGSGKGNFTDAEKTSVATISKYGGVGVDGDGDGIADMWNVTDAIFSAAHYLSMNGGSSGNLENAVHAYNHSDEYVKLVLGYMNLYAQGYSEIDIDNLKDNFLKPVGCSVSSYFGPRIHPVTGEVGKLHKGIDFACATGTLVPASKAGKVIVSGWQDASNPSAGYGIYIRIDHGGGYQTTYGHLSSLNVHVGDMVSAGDVIGASGNTGSSTGPHLHFEILKNGTQVDPAPYIGL